MGQRTKNVSNNIDAAQHYNLYGMPGATSMVWKCLFSPAIPSLYAAPTPWHACHMEQTSCKLSLCAQLYTKIKELTLPYSYNIYLGIMEHVSCSGNVKVYLMAMIIV